MERITSSSDPKIKLSIQLRETRQRKKLGLTLIDGVREVLYAMRAGVEIELLIVDEQIDDHPEWQVLLNEKPSQVVVYQVPSELFAKVTYGDRASSVVAIAKAATQPLELLGVPDQGWILVLDRLEKPGNLGAIMRTADAVGVDAVILCDPICEPYNPNAIRASQGAIFTTPIASGCFDDVWQWLQMRGFQIYAARVDGSDLYYKCDFTAATAIVLGNEAEGLGSQWSHPSVHACRLPMLGTMDSLNVSVTAGVLAYEVWRQRHCQEKR